MSRKPPHFWRLSPFISLFSDPYIEGTELEGGNIAISLLIVEFILKRFLSKVKQNGLDNSGLTSFSIPDFDKIENLRKAIESCTAIATQATESENAEDLMKIVLPFIETIKLLPENGYLLAPGGWVGLTSQGSVLYIIQKTSDSLYSFIICNSGSGLEYHPSCASDNDNTPPKMKYKTSMKIEHIPIERITDIGFWLIMFTLWVKQGSEYHRVEVIYDVLLPWLAATNQNGIQRLLPEALLQTAQNPYSQWKTPQRSGTSSFRCVWHGMTYLLRTFNLSVVQQKQLTYLLRAEFLYKSIEELLAVIKKLPNTQPLIDRAKQQFNLDPQKQENTAVARPTVQQLLGVVNQSFELINNRNDSVPLESLLNKTIGIYFSAHWCPPCKQFTPLLVELYNTIKSQGKQFEIVFVSSDRNKAQFTEYFRSMPWLAVNFDAIEARNRLSQALGVKGIPTLILFDSEGNLLTTDGRSIVSKDPQGKRFPWDSLKQAPPTDKNELPVLDSVDIKILQFATQQYAKASIKEYELSRLSQPLLERSKDLIFLIDELVQTVPNNDKKSGGLPPLLQTDLKAVSQPFYGCHLLVKQGTDKYTGDRTQTPTPNLANLLEVPVRATNLEQVVGALIRCDSICDDLFARARDGSTSSRLVLQYEAIALITTVFTEVIPIPVPLDVPSESAEAKNCIWRTGLSSVINSAALAAGTPISQVQLLCLQRIHKLALTYATAWQAIEHPTRDFDSERSLVSSCMLAIFDIIIRTRAPDGLPLLISELLSQNGGYAISTTVCQDNRGFEQIASWMQFSSPALTIARDAALAYLSSLNRVCKNQLFPLRMPDKIEFKKYSASVEFLRKFMEMCGYELIPRDNPNPPPEMEALMDWMLSDRSQLAQDHPEFHMLRDMAALYKFLATMETREAELLRKRMELRPVYWKLSFEESTGMRYADWRTQVRPLQWEAVNFRGYDMDTADVMITAFGGREIQFGEGPVVNSPSNVSTILQLPTPSEDDILHCDKLPTFGGTISREESEQLLSFLTVDYIRIPLVVGFFASQDRVTYLFNSQLQSLFRAVLFESGPWVPKNSQGAIDKIPIRKTASQILESIAERRKYANIQEEVKVLGTNYGLLVNELQYAPKGTVPLLIEMFYSIKDLSKSSVYSPDAAFILFMIEVAIDVQEYIVFTIELLQSKPLENKQYNQNTLDALEQYRKEINVYLHGLAAETLERYRLEAERASDILTSCVTHAYLALLWTSVRANELTSKNVQLMIGSIAYVRNWHGFGLGQNRSDLILENEDELSNNAEHRLVRFLQSRGIDTSRIAKGSLDQFISSSHRRRPLFLHIGRDVVRAPTLIRRKVDQEDTDPLQDENDMDKVDKVPPVDVPESRLFNLLQKQRRSIVNWFDHLNNEKADEVLGNIMRVALRSPDFEYQGWKRLQKGTGRYVAERAELKMDLQTAEILWRNDELKPVPDSMTQYSDFETIFGREALHCGLVMRQEHRLWVHIVGSAYDLIEWDKPTVVDQGLGAPAPPSKEEAADPGQICLRCGDVGNCWDCKTCTVWNCGTAKTVGVRCDVCGTPKGGINQPNMFGNEQEQIKVETTEVMYNGVVYNRPYDPFSEEEHEHDSEKWVINLVQPLLVASYPPPDGMPYILYFPEKPLPANASVSILLGCDGSDKEDATWREFVVLRNRQVVNVYNLVSHGRKMYRSIIFSSNSKFCLHSLPPNIAIRSSPVPPELKYAAGDLKKKRTNDSSLLITRSNPKLGGGVETFIPPRLLQGIIPSSLLETFHFWQGEDLIIRGEPIDEDSQWFNYIIEIDFKEATMESNSGVETVRWFAEIIRKPSSNGFTMITVDESSENKIGGFVREDAKEGIADHNSVMTDINVMQLVQLGFSPAACRLALTKTNFSLERASEWLFDESNAADIIATEISFANEMSMETDSANEEVNNLRQSQSMLTSSSMSLQDTKIRNSTLLAQSQTISKVHLLEEEGFSNVASAFVLEKFGGDIDLARVWLLDEDNSLQIAMLEEKTDAESGIDLLELDESTGDDKISLRSTTSVTISASLKLLNLLDTPEEEGSNSVLFRLATVLSRIEDLSHILVWTTTSDDLHISRSGFSEQDSSMLSTFKISVIELPRLKIKFQPRQDQDGEIRLYLLDYAGWYVSDNYTVNAEQQLNTQLPGAKFLHNLLTGVENCLIIENDAQELQVLVANHDLLRPKIKGKPFTTDILSDRSSLGWQQVMESRFYLYPVHTSKTFLLTKTLSSALYMILLKFLNRDYSAAMKQIESCHVDTAFTPEEQWVFDQFERTNDDMHPDAHACRLKLTLAIMYSDNKGKWEVHVEMDKYLAKLQHVSTDCRLNIDEEIDILYHCKSGTSRIKNRLDYLNALKAGQANVELKPAAQRWGGQPWMKLRGLTSDYIDSNGSKITRIHYKRPESANDSHDPQAAALARALGVNLPPSNSVKDKNCLELVWDDALLSDEESGSNRQLGFLFLYEVALGTVKLIINGQDISSSLGELLIRYFHLKLARWGKETVDEGESEAAASRQIAWLAAMLESPANNRTQWPVVPTDNETSICLRRGFNLYTAQNRDLGFLLKSYLDAVDNHFKTVLVSQEHQILLAHQNLILNQARLTPLSQINKVKPIPANPTKEPPKLRDTGCDYRELLSRSFPSSVLLRISEEDVQSFVSFPLGPIQLEKYLTYVDTSKKVSSKLPFNISSHPASESIVAKEMLSRISEDVNKFAEFQNSSKSPKLNYLLPEQIDGYARNTNADGIQTAIDCLDEIIEALKELLQIDSQYMENAIQQVQEKANVLPKTHNDIKSLKYTLERISNQRPSISFDLLTAALLSSTALEDLKEINPFITDLPEIFDLLPSILLHTSRITHANRAISQSRGLQALLRMLQRSQFITTNVQTVIEKIHQTSNELAENLTSSRFYIKEQSENGKRTFSYDPRYLVFEYIFEILLRKRQVEMVDSFVASCRNGESRVQQMIMGAGKTTVVGPLLALILADGKSLVTQVMPTALLEQSRNILRSRFSSIIIKRVYTVQFDRSCEDSVELVARLFSKLDNARRTRSVVCSAPEAIKSLMLKFVEQLHSVEQLDMQQIEPGESQRTNKEIVRLRDMMVARSDMADALVKILQLWKDGILIMDEVDVLLHPLRSELNFPIGNKQPIDLSGYRWDLPIHLIDAIFYIKRREISEPFSVWAPVFEKIGKANIESVETLLQQIENVIKEGYACHALQKNPHLVLLSPSFYEKKLKPLMAKWALLWLYRFFVGTVQVSYESLLAYLQGEHIEENRVEIENGLLAESKKLLNLGASWIKSILPHILSKINRVSYGILGPIDISVADPRTPQSRLLMAVPFVGKDVPSRSSEFAHPDVLIGLTILAFRYEGLRKSDLKRVVTQLKQDYSRQVGPRERRPACVIFDQWLAKSLPSSSGDAMEIDEFSLANKFKSTSVLPLPLFQPNDPKQLSRLFTLTRRLPELLHYLLRQHIFPACMNFQKLKISACGHELGSDILFGRRIGFSGTPSNLLPIDLGICEYEPCSDGKIIHVLTSPKVTSSAYKSSDWTARSLLKDMATNDPPFNALIDTGALITGMDNEEVAKYLLLHLPDWMEGVVYLDRQDRQMILLRHSGRSVNLAQCGISPAKRFTFYDQVTFFLFLTGIPFMKFFFYYFRHFA